MSGTVRVEDEGGVRTLTLNRPERRNALTPEMRAELISALEVAGRAASCRVVVLAAAGDTFCAGLDLKLLAGVAERGEEADASYMADAEQVALMFRTLYECPKPTVAAVRGAAVGGGAGLATLCDFTLAEPEAWFAYSEVKIGFVPAVVSAYLVLQVGEKRARDLLLTGRRLNAEEAFRIGLVNELVPQGTLAERTKELTGALMRNSPASLRATKELLAAQNREWLDAAIEAAIEVSVRSRRAEDFQEGLAAFLEKREPVWERG